MKRWSRILEARVIIGIATLSVPAQHSRADLIVDHQPLNSGGLASDTLFLNSFNQPFSQRVADNFLLSGPETITRLTFWAFYDLDNPPSQETIRVRFYGARSSDGLPDEGNIAYEENLSNPLRIATGRRIAVTVSPHEYQFQATLQSSMTFSAGVKYWLEIAQIGDLSTHLRWEFSLADLDGQAYTNFATGNDWRLTTLNPNGDTAFQLYSAPEPLSFPILILLPILFRPHGRTLSLAIGQLNPSKRSYNVSQIHHILQCPYSRHLAR